MATNYYAAIDEVLGVIRDGSRSDRHLHPTPHGKFYLTTEAAPGVSVFVPVGNDTTEEQERELAEELVERCASGGDDAAESDAAHEIADAVDLS